MSTFTTLTVTYRQDLERFLLLRASMRHRGLADMAEHVCVVHTEDLASFRALPRERGLHFIPSSEFLEPRVERRRAAVNFRRTRWRHYVPGGALPGWYAQQLTKLAAASSLGAGSVLVIDSDLVQTSAVTLSELVDGGGRGRLFVDGGERGDGTAGWNEVSAKLLGVKVDAVAVRQYIHAPFVFDVPTLNRMLVDVAGPGGSWQSSMIRANAFEYPTYGIWASIRDRMPLPESLPLPVKHFTHFRDLWSFEADVARLLAEESCRFMSVQSRLHVPPAEYAHVIGDVVS